MISYDIKEFNRLLSPEAEGRLEEMARAAHEITLRHFGRTIQLYSPIYVSNYCDNACLYCGFNINNDIVRKKLTLDEVEKEACHISSTGIKTILLLTGESREVSPVNYIKDCVKILRKYFASVAIEIYPLTETEYSGLAKEGVDGLTIYQEVYDKDIYKKIHPSGPKSDYLFRLDAPERGARAGMRSVNIGVLLGLNDWRKEIFQLGLHAKNLQDKFPDVEIGASVPRIRPQAGNFKPNCAIDDKAMAQIICALRIFMPRLGISLSTRERPELRENLLPLGITKMSAGSTTVVGGHTLNSPSHSHSSRAGLNLPYCSSDNRSCQFEISDDRSVDEIKQMIEKKGYQPVFKDWMNI